MSIDLDEVKDVVVTTLGVQDRADMLDAESPLIEYLPELDSMGAMQVVAALEDRFQIALEPEDLAADVFETLRNLAALVDRKQR